jgi:PAS domain S-box-containing protein
MACIQVSSANAQNTADIAGTDSLSESKRILIVYSKERSNERLREITSGFSSYHSGKKTQTRITSMFLNGNGDRNREEMLNMLNNSWRAYRMSGIDLILATDIDALDLIMSMDGTQGNLPPVLCIKLAGAGGELRRGVSYVLTTIPVRENIELGMELFPNTSKILFISDDTQYGEREAEFARRITGKIDTHVNVEYLSPKGLKFDEFLKKINSLPLNSFAILSSWKTDTIGNYKFNNTSYPFLSEIENIPVFGIQNLMMGTGVIGGYTVSSWDQGYEIAEKAQWLIENPGNVIRDTLSNYMLEFDFSKLRRWNISSDKLPKGATILNKPPSLYDDYRTEVQLFLSFILLLLTSFMVFAVYHFRYRMLNKELMRLTRENIRRKDLLNNTLSVMKEGVISFSPDFSIIDANYAAQELSEYKRGMIGKKFHEVFNTSQSEENESIRNLLAEAAERKESLRIPENTRIDYRERESRYIAGNVTPVLDSAGNVSQIVLVMRDVTDFIKQKRYLQLALESAKSFIWFYNTNTKQFVVVENYENIFGTSGKKFVTHKNFLDIVHPDDRDKLALSYEKLKLQQTKSFTVEYRLSINNDGNWEWWERRGIVYSSARSMGGETRFLYGMDINIDALKKRENEFLEAKIKAEESDRLKSSFLSNMSHEIRTPLNGIVGFANLISDPSYSSEEKEEFSSIINSNSKALMTLISDILDISRIESNSMVFEFTRFDLGSQIDEIADVCRLNLKKEIKIITVKPEEKREICADIVRNRQVISNLVGNALKFTEKGEIKIAYSFQTDCVEVVVSDTGKGIPEEALDSIFSRFYKTDEHEKGTGLGLSICKAIVEKFGGKIWVESVEGKGSSFHYTIPYDIETRIASSAENSSQMPGGPLFFTDESFSRAAKNESDRKKILVAEDLDSNFMLVDIILSKKYEVLRAVNGEQALSYLNQFNPDIILMDIKMPVMDGLTATKEIRKIPNDIPVIALTANAFESDHLEAIEAGCNEVLTKPVKSTLMLSVIEKYLNR